MLNDTMNDNDGLWKSYRVSFIGRVRAYNDSVTKMLELKMLEPTKVNIVVLAKSKEEAKDRALKHYEYLWGQLHVDQELNGKILVEDRV